MTEATKFSVDVPVAKLAKATAVSATFTGIVNGVQTTVSDSRTFTVGSPTVATIVQPKVTAPSTSTSNNIAAKLRLGSYIVSTIKDSGTRGLRLTVGNGRAVRLVKKQPKGNALRIKSFDGGEDLYITL